MHSLHFGRLYAGFTPLDKYSMLNTKQKPSLTILVPFYNEEEVIHETLSRMLEVKKSLDKDLIIDFLFIDDGSDDDSMQILAAEADSHSFIKIISLSRNFGHQIAVTAGLQYATSDWVVIIDADLQDPPELIGEMFGLATSGSFDVVYGRRKSRQGETLFKKITAATFYRLLSYFCDVDIPVDTGDFRLISKRVVDVFNSMPEKHRFVRGMIPWIGFRSAPLLYDRSPRFAGETKYPLRKMLSFAINAITSFSSKPLTMAIKLGLFIIFMGILWAIYAVYLRYFTTLALPGFTAILVAIVIFSGIQIFLLGVIGEYLARIFEEAKARPLFIISKKINL